MDTGCLLKLYDSGVATNNQQALITDILIIELSQIKLYAQGRMLFYLLSA